MQSLKALDVAGVCTSGYKESSWTSKPSPECTDFRVEGVSTEEISSALISYQSSGGQEEPSAHVAVG